MTLQELCEKYKVSENSVLTQFPRTQKSILKKYNVKIVKEGRGATAVYKEELDVEDDKRANSIFEEVKDDFMISKESLKLINWDFMCFLGIVMTPMLVFRGSYVDFLKYVDCKVNDKNIEELKNTLQKLTDEGLISYTIDKTDSNYFIAGLYRRTEVDMRLDIEMVRDCKMLAHKYNKRSWIPLLKTWIGVELLAKNQPFTIKQLMEVTGQSEYQVKSSMKILKESQIFKTTRAYLYYDWCLGSNVDLYAEPFYQLDNKKSC